MSYQPPFVPSPTHPPMFAPFIPPASQTRSMGMKLLLVCGLALVMMLPALYISSLVEERTHRANDVAAEVSTHEGGPQNFLGPILAVPYSVPTRGKGAPPVWHTYLFFPAQADAALYVKAEERRRSLFKVPVLATEAQLDATFDLSGVKVPAPEGSVFDWPHAEIVIGVRETSSALSDATLTSAGKSFTFAPSTVLSHLRLEPKDGAPELTMLGVGAPSQAGPQGRFQVSAKLRFSGAQRVSVLPYGQSTHLAIGSNWRSPSFDGGLLPIARQIDNKGFRAEWNVPFIARGIPAMSPSDDIGSLDARSLGITFAEVAAPYQSVDRSMKYSPLFIGLVFLAYFVFEATAGKRLHPAQYVLVGLAQTIFYMLLLSLSERFGFDLAFVIGGGATIALLSANAGWVFKSRKQAYRALAVFSLLYTTIYMLLRLEDNALLVGAVASFVAVAGAMYLTRSIDWYGSWSGSATGSSTTPPSPPFPADARTSVFPGGVI